MTLLEYFVNNNVIDNYIEAGYFSQDFIAELQKYFLDGLYQSEQSKFIVIAGSPGAGKTTYYKHKWKNWPNHHFHSMDEILVKMPSFKRDLADFNQEFAFHNNWRVAQDLAEFMLSYAVMHHFNIVYDRAGGTARSFFSIYQAKHQYNYHVSLYGLYVDKQVAQQRIIDRAEMTGRTVPFSIMNEYRCRFRTLWPYYLGFVDYAELNHGSGDPQFKTIYSSDKGTVDQSNYNRFLAEDLYPDVMAEISSFQIDMPSLRRS